MTERTPSIGRDVWEFFDEGVHPDHRWRHYRCNGERTVNGLEIVSVTTALGVLNKEMLVTWAGNTDTEGCFELARPGTPWRRCLKCNGVTLSATCDKMLKGKKGKKGRKTLPDEPDQPDYQCDGGTTSRYRLPYHWLHLKADMESAGLWHDSVRDEAALRGTTVHEIREAYVKTGAVPNPARYRVEWRGYVISMVRYIMWCEKRGLVPESVETVVGSSIYGFAGACDFVGVATGPDGERERHDYKTSKQTYAKSHFRQIGAYDGAAVEMGIPACSKLGIVILPPNGEFDPKYHISYAHEVEWPEGGPYRSFLNVLQVWRDDKPLKEHEDATYKARAAREKAAKAAAKDGAK